jgi:hypothetical protein
MAGPSCGTTPPPSNAGMVFNRSRVESNAKALDTGLNEALTKTEGDRTKISENIGKFIDFLAPALKMFGIDDAKLKSFKDGIAGMIKGAAVTSFATQSLQSAAATEPPKLVQTQAALERLATKYDAAGNKDMAEQLRRALGQQFQPAM